MATITSATKNDIIGPLDGLTSLREAIALTEASADMLTISSDARPLADILFGFTGATSGNDTIFGTDGVDTIDGLGGNDTIQAGHSIDNVFGGTGDDLFVVTRSELFDNVNGGTGTDTLDHSGQIYVFGRDTVDFLAGQMVFNDPMGNTHNTTLSGIDIFHDSNNGNDIIADDTGMTIYGNGGDDRIFAGNGNDILDGGANGAVGDTINFTNLNTRIFADLRNSEPFDVGGNTISNFENIVGTNFDDRIHASGSGGFIYGGRGNDNFFLAGDTGGGFTNPTFINGGSHRDWIRLGEDQGSSTSHDLTSTTLVLIEALRFSDLLPDQTHDVFFTGDHFSSGGLSENLRIEFSSIDSGASETIHIDMDTITSLDLSGFTLTTVDAHRFTTGFRPVASSSTFNIIGSDNNDTITGSSIVDTIYGGDGDDIINAGDRRDTIFASGDFDIIDGGADIDLFDLSTSLTGVNWVNLGASSSQFRVNEGGDWVARAVLTNIENVKDSSGADHFFGDAADNIYFYTAGLDTIDGGGGFDTLDISAMTAGFQWIDLEASSSQMRSYDGISWIANGVISNIEYFITTDDTDHFRGDSGDSTVLFTGGRDFIDGRAGNDTIDMSNYDQGIWVNANIAYDHFRFFNGTNWVSGGNMANVESVIGGDGNDFFFGGLGDDQFDGGFGLDRFQVDGTLADYTLSESGGTYTLTGISGTDTLIDVEQIELGGVLYFITALDELI